MNVRPANEFANVAGIGAMLCMCGLVHAQVGLLDQCSPMSPTAANAALFNMSSVLPWQQQVRVGVSGKLSGLRFTLAGPIGGMVRLRLRRGGVWSTQPAFFDVRLTKQIANYEVRWLDTSAADIYFGAGQTFVIETFALATIQSLSLIGSHVSPSAGPALYVEPLNLSGIPFSDGGWRHGFETYMNVPNDPCPGDFNADGGVDGSDVSAFFAAWEGGDLNADVNKDGGIDGTDITTYLADWAGGRC